MNYFTHLECASGCGAGPFDPRVPHFLCPSCELPLLARYDLTAARAWARDSLVGREPNMWRYREVLPLLPGEEPVTLGEGFTPLLHARRLGSSIGLTNLFIKDESINPTNSFKARGLSAAVTRARTMGRLVIGVAINEDKGPLFSLQERVEMVQEQCAKIWGGAEIVIQPFDTLLMKFAESVGAQIIVRGLRAVADFEYEFAMVGMNQKLNPAIETVFLMADPTHQAVAPQLVKEIARLQGSVAHFVPKEVEGRLKAKFGVS